MEIDPTQRFGTRAEHYRRFRPAYPAQFLQWLGERCGLAPGRVVADLGAGTGILSAQLLDVGARVWAVEPNPAMRAAAEGLLGAREGFTSVEGTAEATTLAPGSVSLVTAGQAFHWFDPLRARAEAVRILAPGGWAALVWNEHGSADIPFMADYEALLRCHAPEYAAIRARRAYVPAMRTFFGGEPERVVFPNQQVLDFEGLQGRTLSSSYVPERGEPGHEALLAELRVLFARHQCRGRVIFPYETQAFCGQPGRRG